MNEIRETALDLDAAGLIGKRRLGEYEELYRTDSRELPPEEIRNIRSQTLMSQAVLAAILNVGVSTVQKWETDEKKPAGASLKLLNLVRRKGTEILYI
ncbi:helix-turn-helix domain-containing protein [Marinobacter sp. NSM]|uniref:helix-turn-helix domain-containing protein n=1 Tax=Marinobacter sp. NSM TaxID=3458004 RepID=UPI004035B11C